jgi:hypothetical protein
VLAGTAAGELHRAPTDERENSPPSTTARGRGGHSPLPLPKNVRQAEEFGSFLPTFLAQMHSRLLSI